MKTKTINESLDEFVAHWGFCPHGDGQLCQECVSDPAQRSFSYGDLSTLNHERQVAIFNFCSCEDNDYNENPYDDCPDSQTIRIRSALGR